MGLFDDIEDAAEDVAEEAGKVVDDVTGGGEPEIEADEDTDVTNVVVDEDASAGEAADAVEAADQADTDDGDVVDATSGNDFSDVADTSVDVDSGGGGSSSTPDVDETTEERDGPASVPPGETEEEMDAGQTLPPDQDTRLDNDTRPDNDTRDRRPPSVEEAEETQREARRVQQRIDDQLRTVREAPDDEVFRVDPEFREEIDREIDRDRIEGEPLNYFRAEEIEGFLEDRREDVTDVRRENLEFIRETEDTTTRETADSTSSEDPTEGAARDFFDPTRQVDEDLTFSEEAVVAGVDIIETSEEYAGEAAENIVPQIEPSETVFTGLANGETVTDPAMFGEPTRVQPGTRTFETTEENIETAREGTVGATQDVIQGPGTLGGFIVGGSGATVRSFQEAAAGGSSVGEQVISGGGKIREEFEEDPQGFLQEEALEEVGEGIFTAGIGILAVTPTVTPESTPSPEVEPDLTFPGAGRRPEFQRAETDLEPEDVPGAEQVPFMGESEPVEGGRPVDSEIVPQFETGSREPGPPEAGEGFTPEEIEILEARTGAEVESFEAGPEGGIQQATLRDPVTGRERKISISDPETLGGFTDRFLNPQALGTGPGSLVPRETGVDPEAPTVEPETPQLDEGFGTQPFDSQPEVETPVIGDRPQQGPQPEIDTDVTPDTDITPGIIPEVGEDFDTEQIQEQTQEITQDIELQPETEPQPEPQPEPRPEPEPEIDLRFEPELEPEPEPEPETRRRPRLPERDNDRDFIFDDFQEQEDPGADLGTEFAPSLTAQLQDVFVSESELEDLEEETFTGFEIRPIVLDDDLQ